MAYQNYVVEEYKNLKELLLGSAQAYGDRTAYKEKRDGVTVSYSFRQAASDAMALAEVLASMGCKGRRIVIAGTNCYAWAVAFFAVTTGLGCAVSLDHATDAKTLAEIVSETDAAAVLCSPDFLPKTDSLDPKVLRISFAEFDGMIARDAADTVDEPEGAPDEIDPDFPAAIFFTSSVRRGVVLSHKNLCFDIVSLRKMIRLDHGDMFLSILPIHHAYETTCGFLVPFSCGATVAFSEGLRFLTREMKEYHPTVLNCVPYIAETMYRKVESNIRKQGLQRSVLNMIRVTNAIRPEVASIAAKRRAFSFVHKSFGGKLRLILCAGAPSDPSVLHGFRNYGILAIQAYTIVECSPVAAINRDHFYNDSSAGLSLPDTLIDIYDMQDDGIGEIRCKGDFVMLGYFNDPESTKQVLRDGWFYTGDLGYFDQDGFLHIIGRKKNAIVTGAGKQIFPEEIEALLNSTKYVRESLVRAVPFEDEDGVRVEAVLYPDKDTIAALEDDNPRQRALAEMRRAVSEVNAVLPDFKKITSYSVTSSPLPRNTSGSLER